MTFHKPLEVLLSMKNKSEKIRILVYYRYLSLIMTSLFYFVSDFNHTIQRKCFIMISISISAMLLTYLYIKNEEEPAKIKLLIFLETVGNSFILIPSGGLNSPYIWYALNTMMMASIKLNMRHCLINLCTYLGTTTAVVYLVVGKGSIGELARTIKNQSNLMVSFVLITAAIHLLSRLIENVQKQRDELKRSNEALASTNLKLKESVEHIIALYQAVHSFSNKKNDHELTKLFIHYAKIITKTDTVFFIRSKASQNRMIVEEEKNKSQLIKNKLENEIISKWDSIIKAETPIEVEIEGHKIMLAALKSTYKIYGILGIEKPYDKEGLDCKEDVEQVQFLSELGSMVLERAYLEEVNERLIVTQEQNRIANEIHDNVLQRLFGMSFSIYTLIKNIEKNSILETKKELNFIRSSIDNTMKDLRTTIYGLSWQKNGINSFHKDIIEYIEEIQKLTRINIVFNSTGNHDFLSIRQKKALYRMICEGIGNAVRHGKADHITVNLDIKDMTTILEIMDDGVGFNMNETKEDKHMGLGLRNMHYLVRAMNGEIQIDSKIGKGTSIKVNFPNDVPMLEKGDAV